MIEISRNDWLNHQRRWWRELLERRAYGFPRIHGIEYINDQELRDITLALMLDQILRRTDLIDAR